MAFKVGLTDAAIADLKGIVEYVARDSAEAAAFMGNELIATAESLSILPHRGAPVTERSHLRKLVRWHYALYYRVKENRETCGSTTGLGYATGSR